MSPTTPSIDSNNIYIYLQKEWSNNIILVLSHNIFISSSIKFDLFRISYNSSEMSNILYHLQELEDQKKRQLTLVEFYEATHEKKGDGEGTFWTKEAEDMRVRISDSSHNFLEFIEIIWD